MGWPMLMREITQQLLADLGVDTTAIVVTPPYSRCSNAQPRLNDTPVRF